MCGVHHCCHPSSTAQWRCQLLGAASCNCLITKEHTKESDAFAVCFPLWFQVFHLLSAMSLPLRLIHCCLDTRPLKVIKKSLSSCVQSLCLRKKFSGNSTRKITLLVQTLSFIREGEAGGPSQSWRSWPFLYGDCFAPRPTQLLESLLDRLWPGGRRALWGFHPGPGLSQV